MKHLKNFLESLNYSFDESPVQLNSWEDYKKRVKNKQKEYFTKQEWQDLVDIFESNGYRQINEEGDEFGWEEHGLTGNFFNIGLSFIDFSIASDNDNPHRIEVNVTKYLPDWFYVGIHQEEYDGDDDGFDDYDEYWEIDSFRPLINFLKTNCKFK
jgi:hypothetical protein